MILIVPIWSARRNKNELHRFASAAFLVIVLLLRYTRLLNTFCRVTALCLWPAGYANVTAQDIMTTDFPVLTNYMTLNSLRKLVHDSVKTPSKVLPLVDSKGKVIIWLVGWKYDNGIAKFFQYF